MAPSLYSVGIDVSKDTLDCCGLPEPVRQPLPNTPAGHAGIVAQLLPVVQAGTAVLVVLEATGGYERALHAALSAAGVACAIVNPKRVRDFARSKGRRVFPQLSVRENLEMGAYLRKDRDGIARDMERIFDRFLRLKERLHQAAGTLSGGEQQMLAIARALMSRPKIVLFDEPSLGLAPNLVERTFEIRREGTTVLMVEQNALAAREMCDRSYLLETGQVIEHGTGSNMLGNPHIQKAYLGG